MRQHKNKVNIITPIICFMGPLSKKQAMLEIVLDTVKFYWHFYNPSNTFDLLLFYNPLFLCTSKTRSETWSNNRINAKAAY